MGVKQAHITDAQTLISITTANIICFVDINSLRLLYRIYNITILKTYYRKFVLMYSPKLYSANVKEECKVYVNYFTEYLREF